MTETPETAANPKKSATDILLGFFRRPIEYGLTGAALVGVLFLANESDILPKVFKGAGFEVEFQERVVQSTASTEAGVELLKKQVTELQRTVAALRNEIGQNGPAVPLEQPELRTDAEADGAAKDSLLIDRQQILQTQGFMWLGTFDPVLNVWTDVSAAQANGDPMGLPSELSQDQSLVLTTTVNLRDGLPPNDEAYFRAVRALGVADTGTRATLLAAPQIYDRAGVHQVWSHVTVAIRPYIGVQQSE